MISTDFAIEKFLDETLPPDTDSGDRLWFKESTLSLAERNGWEWIQRHKGQLRAQAELIQGF